MSQEHKKWYYSKTIWGSLIAVGAALLGAFGHPIDQDTQLALTDAVLQIVAVGGSLFAIFGRLDASAMIE